MTTRAISYAKLQRRHVGKFIAREGGKVRASGETYPALLKVIRKRRLNRNTLIVGYAPPKKAICIYSVLDASRKSGRVSAKAVKHKAGLSSIASRAKGRAPSLQSIVREVHAYRRASGGP